MRAIALVVMAVLGTAASPVRADEVTDGLDQARSLYDAGDVGGAATELNFVVQALRTRLAEAYRAGFPDAPAGWTVEDDQDQGDTAAMAMFGGGTAVSRSYRAQDGSGQVKATLLLDNPMIQGFAGMMNNPAVLASKPNAKRVRVGRDNAIVEYDAANRTGESNLILGGRMMLQLQGSDLGDATLLESLTQAWKFDVLKKLAGM